MHRREAEAARRGSVKSFLAEPGGVSLGGRPARIALRELLKRVELRLAALVAMALLCAQVGALSHAYAHDADARAPGTAPPAASPAGAAAHDPCNDCLAYAPLLCAAGTPTVPPAINPQSATLAVRRPADSVADLDPTLAFRARAPPTAP